jgi:DNA repair protein SbcD/Mre11
MTRIVHTADWHLGVRLIDCDRHEEHSAFLDWLLAELTVLRPDLLIVAGDIFDGSSPPQDALNLYYRFLAKLVEVVKCRVLILGGNHDSPAALHAPREILAALNIRVIATPPEKPSDALIELSDVVVCAVPYLRERDVRTAAPGQSADEIAASIREGINRYYRTLHDSARLITGDQLLIGTGHLTSIGSQVSPSERSIHIGNLGAVESTCFDGFAYTALGHIHSAQPVGGNDTVRYVGSPLALSFAETTTPKEIRVIDISDNNLTHRAVAVPTFRALHRVTTSVATLVPDLTALQAPVGAPFPPWIELTVSDGRNHPDLDRQVRDSAANLNLRVLKVLSPSVGNEEAGASHLSGSALSLDDLKPAQVFIERLRTADIDADSDEARTLIETFEHLLTLMQETPDLTISSGKPQK